MSPREAEAVAVAADALDGAGDPAALVVALVAELARRGRLPEREVAVVLAGLVKGHKIAAKMVRWVDPLGQMRTLLTGSYEGIVLRAERELWRIDGPVRTSLRYPTREAAEAALLANQPEPRAVIQVRS